MAKYHGAKNVLFITKTRKRDNVVYGEVCKIDNGVITRVYDFSLSTCAQPVKRVRALVYGVLCSVAKSHAANHAYLN